MDLHGVDKFPSVLYKLDGGIPGPFGYKYDHGFLRKYDLVKVVRLIAAAHTIPSTVVESKSEKNVLTFSDPKQLQKGEFKKAKQVKVPKQVMDAVAYLAHTASEETLLLQPGVFEELDQILEGCYPALKDAVLPGSHDTKYGDMLVAVRVLAAAYTARCCMIFLKRDLAVKYYRQCQSLVKANPQLFGKCTDGCIFHGAPPPPGPSDWEFDFLITCISEPCSEKDRDGTKRRLASLRKLFSGQGERNHFLHARCMYEIAKCCQALNWHKQEAEALRSLEYLASTAEKKGEFYPTLWLYNVTKEN